MRSRTIYSSAIAIRMDLITEYTQVKFLHSGGKAMLSVILRRRHPLQKLLGQSLLELEDTYGALNSVDKYLRLCGILYRKYDHAGFLFFKDVRSPGTEFDYVSRTYPGERLNPEFMDRYSKNVHCIQSARREEPFRCWQWITRRLEQLGHKEKGIVQACEYLCTTAYVTTSSFVCYQLPVPEQIKPSLLLQGSQVQGDSATDIKIRELTTELEREEGFLVTQDGYRTFMR